MIRDQSLGFERVNTAADDKIRGLSDRASKREMEYAVFLDYILP